ncbi:MAG: exodeoxyribonuclease VII small subunit [Clostridiaceae bacterium]|jgi:exodeoxyribonuclease VII small subunit|nr:exodeoxyribonuclease VII small subunit [Clostridiaceae bacterium]
MELNLSYEEAVKQLEEIVQLLEKGDIPLEKSLELFQKGVALSAYCTKKLDETEKKILKMIDENSEYREEPLSLEDE